MNNEIEESFSGLTSAFNTKFEMEDKPLLEQVNSGLKDIELRKNEIIKNKRELVIEDQDFLNSELKSLILNARAMACRLENEIKVGSRSDMYDAYFKAINAIGNQLKELRELNKTVVDIEIQKQKIERPDQKTNRATIVLDANSLLELVKKAKKDSQMDAIDADFSVEEDEAKFIVKK